ncbi:MAG: hypothetical protein IPN15_18005 [Saprospiraceae bacterium]|nr:hypothetical protein [Candidatus Vicinibacter affinis]
MSWRGSLDEWQENSGKQHSLIVRLRLLPPVFHMHAKTSTPFIVLLKLVLEEEEDFRRSGSAALDLAHTACKGLTVIMKP